jgi:hypothetical protein
VDQPTHPATANPVRSTVSFDLTATGQGVPVGAEGHRINAVGVAGEDSQQVRLTGVTDIPQSRSAIEAAGGQSVPVRAKGNAT